MAYLEIPSAKQKIMHAREKQLNILITAPTGYGKTILIDYYYNEEAKWLNCLTGKISEMPPVDSIEKKVIVIDDISYLVDVKGYEYIKDLLSCSRFQVILIGRADFPDWLSDLLVNYEFVRIWTKDLMFEDEQVKEYLKGYNLTDAEITNITQCSIGYPIAIMFTKFRLDAGEEYDEELTTVRVWDDLLHYFEKNIFDRLQPKMFDMLLTMCPYEEFDVELANAIILTNENITEWIYYIKNVGSILYKVSDNEYAFEPHVRKYLVWKRDFEYSEDIKKDQYRRAGYYFEKKDDLVNALKYYKLAGDSDLVEQVLIRHSNINVGAGQYYELREYYLSIPENRLYKSPNLLATVCILYSMLMMPDKSEELYNVLKEIEWNAKNSPSIRKEAKSRLIWLDISLPHRCGKGLIGILKSAAMMLVKKEIVLPEFSVTSNMPSLMNGGLDMSDWSKIDTQLARFLVKPIEIVLNEQGKGLVNVALAESGFEKGMLDSYEVLTRCHNGYSAAFSYGKYELCFAALSVITRQHILHGQLPSAKKNMDDFIKAINMSEDSLLMRNVSAFCVNLRLYDNSENAAEEFLKVAPDEKEFYVLNRYLYMVKLKCLIATGRYAEAMNLSCVLEEYFLNYGRTIFWIENRAYRSIILYQQNDNNWMSELESAILKAQEYHFVRTLSLIGSPLLKMLSEWKPMQAVDKSFVDEVRKEAIDMARYYPGYLNMNQKINIVLTPQEEKVFALLCQGESLQDIADKCNIKYNSVRVHTHNIYQKLGVSSRTEAEHMAMRLGIVPRGNDK